MAYNSFSEIYFRHQAILNTIQRYTTGATYAQIESYYRWACNAANRVPVISKRNFERDLVTILECYGIEIVYDFKERVYRIEE